MSDNNFIRFFVMLNENEKGYGLSGSPNGYCKVESLDGKAVFTFSIRNIKPEASGYCLYVTLNDNDVPVLASKAMPSEDGTFYRSIETDANDVFSSKSGISDIEAMFVLASDKRTVMSGYPNRNVASVSRHKAEEKIKNISRKEEKTFSAASTDIKDTSDETVLPDEIETDVPPLEDENEPEEKASKESSTADNVASYVTTLAKLYEGIMGAKRQNESKAQDTNYMGLVGDFYDKLTSESESSPFPFSTDNTKWFCINDKNSIDHSILGLVYEDGNIKYIANGTAQRRGFVSAPFGGNAIWFPANDGMISGYWVFFIDAKTGKAVMPDLKIL